MKVPDLQRLLTYPNRNETYADLIYKTVFHIRLTGNAYWFKSESTVTGDRPRELFGLNPKKMRVSLNPSGELIGYLYRTGTKEIPFEPEEILHFKRPHPDNDYYGIGDLEPAEDLIDEHVNRSTWSKAFWKNGAAPAGLLIHKQTMASQLEWDIAKRKWQKEYGGKDNAGKVAWLSGEWDYKQIGLSSADMQEIERTKLSVEQIFLLHGVPLSVAGIRDAANYATASIDDQRFRTYTVMPMVRIIQDTQNTDLVAGWGDNIEVAFNLSGLIDVGKVVLDFTPLFDRGCMSINEIREKAGLMRDDNNPLWNQHFINAGLVPLDLSGIADLGVTETAATRTVQRFVEQSLIPQKTGENV